MRGCRIRPVEEGVSFKRNGGMGWFSYGKKAEGDRADEFGY